MPASHNNLARVLFLHYVSMARTSFELTNGKQRNVEGSRAELSRASYFTQELLKVHFFRARFLQKELLDLA